MSTIMNEITGTNFQVGQLVRTAPRERRAGADFGDAILQVLRIRRGFHGWIVEGVAIEGDERAEGGWYADSFEPVPIEVGSLVQVRNGVTLDGEYEDWLPGGVEARVVGHAVEQGAHRWGLDNGWIYDDVNLTVVGLPETSETDDDSEPPADREREPLEFAPPAFKAGDRVRIGNNAAWANGTLGLISLVAGEMGTVSVGQPDKDGDIFVVADGDSDSFERPVAPWHLTPLAPEDDPRFIGRVEALEAQIDELLAEFKVNQVPARTDFRVGDRVWVSDDAELTDSWVNPDFLGMEAEVLWVSEYELKVGDGTGKRQYVKREQVALLPSEDELADEIAGAWSDMFREIESALRGFATVLENHFN